MFRKYSRSTFLKSKLDLWVEYKSLAFHSPDNFLKCSVGSKDKALGTASTKHREARVDPDIKKFVEKWWCCYFLLGNLKPSTSSNEKVVLSCFLVTATRKRLIGASTDKKKSESTIVQGLFNVHSFFPQTWFLKSQADSFWWIEKL